MDSKKAAESSSIAKFFDSKSWKFYAGVIAGLTLAGAGALILSNQQSSFKQRRQPSM
jgi:hypothetical protein